MSCNYADGLSPYDNKGKLGLPEKFDSSEKIDHDVGILAAWLEKSKHTVFHTGAGISTSAGIPDFRGPKGVWTLEHKGQSPSFSISWQDAIPTKTHLALVKLVEAEMVHFVISQNVDGLHLRSGLSRSRLAELHGNMFIDQCSTCRRQFVRPMASDTVGQKISSTRYCPSGGCRRRPCRGRLADFILDWEHELPEDDLYLAEGHSSQATLNVVLGSTLQIVPSGTLPLYGKKYNPEEAKLVIVNLQPTKHDRHADLIIRSYVDDVMEALLKRLEMTIPQYENWKDPVWITKEKPETLIEWTQDSLNAGRMKKIGQEIHNKYLRRRKSDRIKTNASKSADQLVSVSNEMRECSKCT